MALILIQTIRICVIGWIKLKISWLSYILFLIFLGGLIVLFIYITSLASNELIHTKIETHITVVLVISFILFLIILNINFQYNIRETLSTYKTFYFIYSWNSMAVIITTIIYLLLTLIIVVKVSNKFEAPIKNLICK
jgi:NADH-ubiquinone oxidoreductase chain 6